MFLLANGSPTPVLISQTDHNNARQTAEEDQAELYRYDTKVYRASVQMAAALDSELRSLRIPFFVIKSHLVSEQRSLLAETKPKSKDGTDQEKKSGPISREELIALQRRMLDLLQDLCKE